MDPGHQAIILICASISGGPDQEGTEVTMIEHLATWQRELQPLLGPGQIAKLTESVIPHRGGDIQHLAKKLGYGAIVFDAGEFQRISRPRVWWSTIDWDGPNIASVLGPNTTWKKYFGTYQVRCPQPIREAHIPAGWTAPDCWKVGETLPCLTPPAPTESGRAAPRSSKRCMDSATHGRWAANKRQYEPWHYYEHFLMADDQNELRIPPIETKESLQHIPVGYTSRMADKQRHRAVANSWHVGIAGLLMWILLLQTQATSATAQRPAPRTVTHTRLPNSQTPAARWGPPPPPRPKPHFNVAGIEVEIMPDTGKHQAEPRQKTEKRPQYHRHEGRSNRTSQGVQLTADRPWEDTTPWAHSLSTPAPQPGGTRQQCNRASAQPGQANLAQKLNMKLTHAPSDRVRPIGTIGPGTGWRHSPKGRDSQSIHEVRLADVNTGAQPGHNPHLETPLPAIEPDGQAPNRHGPTQRSRQRSRTRVATTVATPIHHQAHLEGPPDHPADSRTVLIAQTRPAGHPTAQRREVAHRVGAHEAGSQTRSEPEQ